jgi:signal transduction histidine kinase
MRDAVSRREPEYTRALRAFVADGAELELMTAYRLGRQSLKAGPTRLVSLHGKALKQILKGTSEGADASRAVDRATQFLAEALAPFEMTVRAFLETNAQLTEANAEMQNAARLKDEFLAQMSHELRTPLNSVLGFVQLLLNETSGTLNEKQRWYCSNIRQGGDLLLNLVNDLLDLSAIRAGLVRLNTESVGLRAVVDECLAQLYPQAEGKRLQLQRQIRPDISVMADRARLTQVLLNLLANGIKFTPEGGTIAVAAEARRRTVTITVSDTGVGIPHDQLASVFDEFVQLDPGREQGRLGTGLGLTLSRRLVELMGGSLNLQSEPGSGSVFTIALASGRAPAEPLAKGSW